MNYPEKLKDPRWQKKRLEVFQRTPFSLEIFANTTCCMNDELRDIFLKTYGDQERANAEPHPA